MQCFIIIAQPRTGSTLICALLNSHPNIRAVIEPFNPIGHTHHMQPIRGSTRIFPQIDVDNNIEKVLDILWKPDPPIMIGVSKKASEAAGFKTMIHHIRALQDEYGFWQYALARRAKIIVICRENILLQYTSDLIAQATGQPACWDGIVKKAKIIVPIDTLSSALNGIIADRNYLLQQVQAFDHRILYYEAFKHNYRVVEDLLVWLVGNTTHLFNKRLTKQNSDDLRDRVINYEEMVAELTRIGFGHYLVHKT